MKSAGTRRLEARSGSPRRVRDRRRRTRPRRRGRQARRLEKNRPAARQLRAHLDHAEELADYQIFAYNRLAEAATYPTKTLPGSEVTQ